MEQQDLQFIRSELILRFTRPLSIDEKSYMSRNNGSCMLTTYMKMLEYLMIDNPYNRDTILSEHEMFSNDLLRAINVCTGLSIDIESGNNDHTDLQAIYSIFGTFFIDHMIQYLFYTIEQNKVSLANAFQTKHNEMSVKANRSKFSSKLNTVLYVNISNMISYILNDDGFINSERVIETLNIVSPNLYTNRLYNLFISGNVSFNESLFRNYCRLLVVMPEISLKVVAAVSQLYRDKYEIKE